jgi:hypothetical protein
MSPDGRFAVVELINERLAAGNTSKARRWPTFYQTEGDSTGGVQLSIRRCRRR